MKRVLFALMLLLFVWTAPSFAENYTVQGEMGSEIRFEIQRNITVVDGINRLTLGFVVPPAFQSPTYNQNVRGFELRLTPRPQEQNKSVDERGNEVITAVWNSPPRAVDVRLGVQRLKRNPPADDRHRRFLSPGQSAGRGPLLSEGDRTSPGQ